MRLKRLVLAMVAVCLLGCGVVYFAHRHWTDYVRNEAQPDALLLFKKLFAAGKSDVSVTIDAVRPSGFFGVAVEKVKVLTSTSDQILFSIKEIDLSPQLTLGGRSFALRATGIDHPSASLAGAAKFRREYIEENPTLVIESADIMLDRVQLSTIVSLGRHFSGNTVLTQLLDWMVGEISGSLRHGIERGSARLVGNGLHMKKLHALLPALAIDEFELGVDYTFDELIFSKESRIHMVNAEIGFRGGLRAIRQANDPLWDLKIQVKAIPIIHALASPIFACPALPLDWRLIAGNATTKTYSIAGTLLAPTCKVLDAPLP